MTTVPTGPARVAIVGTPRTGNTWVRMLLADALEAEQIAVHHPADIDWAGLPERSVLQLHWRRTAYFSAHLARAGYQVVSIARHPLDVLLSTHTFAQKELGTNQWLMGAGGNEDGLRGRTLGGSEFMAWAASNRARTLLSLTPEWWRSPHVQRLRYEDMVADPEGVLRTLFNRIGIAPRDLPGAVRRNDPARLHAESGGVHVWRARPGAWEECLNDGQRELLATTHHDVFESLGYDVQVS